MACKRSSVRSRLPPPKLVGLLLSVSSKVLTPSSRGLGHHPFTVSTGVRIPVGSPSCSAWFVLRNTSESCLPGVVVQLVRIPACHAGGRGFESRPLRQSSTAAVARLQRFFCIPDRRRLEELTQINDRGSSKKDDFQICCCSKNV